MEKKTTIEGFQNFPRASPAILIKHNTLKLNHLHQETISYGQTPKSGIPPNIAPNIVTIAN